MRVGYKWVSSCFFLLLFNRKCSEARKHRKITTVSVPDEDFGNISYHFADAANITSNFVDTLPVNTMPISRVMRRLNRQDSRDSNLSGDSGAEAGSRRNVKVTKTQKSESRKRKSEPKWTKRQFSSLRLYRKYFTERLSKQKPKGSSLPNPVRQDSLDTLDTIL